MKGNYLWPAMWAPSAFDDDDPQNMVLADEMGIVMGTSHHEPMTRAQDEWHRYGRASPAAWDYATNDANLREFWRGGIERMMAKGGGKGTRTLVTLGMRGDGDEPMTEGTAIALLERIVADQRDIIARRHRQARRADAAALGALQGSAGLLRPRHARARRRHAALRRRQLGQHPPPAAPATAIARAASASTTTSTTSAARATTNGSTPTDREDLAADGPRVPARRARIWIVNVGDIKPMEFPLSFFMEQAWDPEAMTPEALARYPRAWARATFGAKQAEEIAEPGHALQPARRAA